MLVEKPLLSLLCEITHPMLVFKKMVKQQFAILPIVANDHHGNN